MGVEGRVETGKAAGREAGPAPEPERLLGVVRGLIEDTYPGRRVEVGPDSRFDRDLGLDSLSRVELMMRVGEAFRVRLPDSALEEANSARELLRIVGQARGVPGGDWRPVERLAAGDAVGLPAQALTLPDVLRWHAARHADRLHVLLYGEDGAPLPITYGALLDDASRIAAGLASRDLQPLQTVALMLPTGADYLAAFFGVLLAGGVPVPIYPPARLAQIEEHLQRHSRILDNAQAALLVTVPQAKPVAFLLRSRVASLRDIVTPDELRVRAAPLAQRVGPDDLAFLQYTSGSTGDPKGVMLSHANLLANIRAMGAALQVTGDDVFVSWLPLYHDMGLIGAWLGSMYFGMPLVLMSPLAFLARPARWLQAIHHHRGTLSAAPNFAYDLVARRLPDDELEGLDLSSWRLAFNGAEAVSPSTLDAFAARFAPFGLRREAVTPVYGLAECSVGLAFPPLGRGPLVERIRREPFAARRLALPAAEGEDALLIPACGRALPGHAMRVVDGSGNVLPDRQVGRLQFRGPSATRGYFRNEEATRALIAGDWLETGDYAYLVEGELFVTGREKDLIIRGGRNVYPYDLEEAVGELPGVRKGCVAVFGAPDPRAGSERLVVLAETREQDPGARSALHARIQDVATLVAGLPADEIVLAPPHSVLKTSSGKIRRAATRDRFLQGLVGQAGTAAWRLKARLALGAAASRLHAGLRKLPAWLYASWVWALFGLLAPPTWAVVALMQRPRAAHYVIHHASRLFFRLIGVPVRVSIAGRLPAKPHVLVVNHGSYLDAVFLVAVLPPQVAYAFAAKSEFTRRWTTRRFFTGIGAIFVERFDPRLSAEGATQLAQALAQGRSVVVFPEGTFTPQDGVRAFRMGAFVAAAAAGAPVVAAGLAGVRAMLRDRTWMPRWGRPQLSIGAIIVPGGEGWREAVAVRDVARQEVVRLSGEPDLLGR